MANLNTKWNLQDVQKIVSEVEAKTGEKLNLELEYNGRLKRALARCLTRVERNRSGEIFKATPFKLEFGKTILNVGEEQFRQTVLHELAHAIANKRHQDNCKHDYRFKQVCAEIGCSNDTRNTSHVEINNAMTYKYTVTCKNCGDSYNYHRKNKFINAILAGGYMPYCCAECQKDEFTVKQNY